MKTRLLFLLPFFVSLFSVDGQILKVDKGYLGIDSSNYFTGMFDIAFALNDRGSTAEEDVVYIGLQNKTDLIYLAEKSATILKTGINYFKIGEGPFVFNGSVHLREVFNRKNRFSPEVYGQAQFDGSRNLDLRALLGGGFRWNVTHPVNTVYLGMGFFNEYEKWDNGEVVENKNLLKLNTYLGVGHEFNNRISISAISYFQSGYDKDIEKLRNRVFASLQLANDVTDKLRLKFTFNYEHDDRPVIPLNRHVFESYVGFEYKFK